MILNNVIHVCKSLPKIYMWVDAVIHLLPVTVLHAKNTTASTVLRETVLNKPYGKHKNVYSSTLVYIYLFSRIIFGLIYYGHPWYSNIIFATPGKVRRLFHPYHPPITQRVAWTRFTWNMEGATILRINQGWEYVSCEFDQSSGRYSTLKAACGTSDALVLT